MFPRYDVCVQNNLGNNKLKKKKMAQNKSLFKIVGTLDDVSFYKSADGYLVRTKGGVSKERVMKDPAFERTRENMEEFGHCAKAGKMLKSSTGGLAKKAKDRRLTSRLQKVMSGIKNSDRVSARGKRQVGDGIATEEGKLLLKGFDFNINAPLQSIMDLPVFVDLDSGKTIVENLIPKEDLNYPDGATHFSMQSVFANLDFATGISNSKTSPVVNLPIDLTVSSPVMNPDGVPVGTGTRIYLLFIAFYQEVNGVQYLLRNGAYNVLNIIEVA